jgi:outer membrane protein TolC
VIELAKKNHPEIEALKAKQAQANARQQAGPSIPPPMVSLGTMGERGPFGGLMENSIELAQTLPFPTKLTAESRERGSMRRAAEAQLDARLLSLRTEAKGAYFELYRVRDQIGLLEEKRQDLENHGKRIRSVTLSDRMAQAHLIRIQTEIELAQNEIAKARQTEAVAQGTLDVVMGRDPSLPVPGLETPPLSELPANTESANIAANHPVLRSFQAQAEALEAGADRASSAWLPDFSLKYRYNRRYDGVMPNNSEVMLGVELPFLLFWQPRAQAAEARARTDEARSNSKQAENELKLKLLKARSNAESLRAQLLSYLNQIIPQALKRMKLAHSVAPTDMESLNEHRESMQSYVELQLAALNLRIDYEKAVSELESFL